MNKKITIEFNKEDVVKVAHAVYDNPLEYMDEATFTKDTTIYDVVLLVGFVSMIMSAIVTVIGFPYWIKQIINPEYYAISDLIAQLK